VTAPDGNEGRRRIAELTGDEQTEDVRTQQDQPGIHASYSRLKDHAIIDVPAVTGTAGLPR
jgi:hypothetical protein